MITTHDQKLETAGLSINEAAYISGVGRTTLYVAIGAGHLPAKKIGKRTIILRRDLLAWLDRLPTITGEGV